MVIFHCFCWWKKSCTTWLVWNPVNTGDIYCLHLFTISTGPGFVPSTVWPCLPDTFTAVSNDPPIGTKTVASGDVVQDSDGLDVFAAFRWNKKGRKRVVFGLPTEVSLISWMVATQIFFIFIPTWGNDSNLTSIFFNLGWFNHQLEKVSRYPGCCLGWFSDPSIISENSSQDSGRFRSTLSQGWA